MFKCVRSQICLHIGDVCDGHNDCPWNDDELMCILVGIKCPKKCKCLNFGIICTNVPFDFRIHPNFPYISVHLPNCKIKFIPNLKVNHNMVVLNLSRNSISTVHAERLMRHLTILDLSYNQLMFIRKYCFDSLQKLVILRLQNNMIEKIEDNSFHNLSCILIVDISNNKLSTFSKKIFAKVMHLTLLILHNNPITGLFVTMFDGLPTKMIVTDNYKICLSSFW